MELLTNIKKMVTIKIELMMRRDKLRDAMLNGRDFFYKQARNSQDNNAKLLAEGSQRMVEIIKEVESIDSEIKGIDTLIISSLEMEINNIDFKFTIPQHPNDSGDVIHSIEAVLSNDFNNENHVINVRDLWSIILLKEMFSVKNIEIINKEER